MATTLTDTALAHLDVIVAAKAGGQPRQGQIQLCHDIAEAITGGAHLIGEAGTGTGKTYAYLAAAVAAIEHYRKTDPHGMNPRSIRRVIIVTATKALQEQLVTDDIPQVMQALGSKVTYALLKGRSNYLCLTKHHEAGQKSFSGVGLFDDTTAAGARSAGQELKLIDAWANVTDTGDRTDLPDAVSDTAWKAVSISPYECPGKNKCSRGAECFAERARERAREADIVIANAALYASELARDSNILGDHELVIIDEAHEFDQAVTDANTTSLSSGGIRGAGANARRAGADQTSINTLYDAADRLDDLLDGIEAEEDERVGRYGRGNQDDGLGDGQLVTVDGDWLEALQTISAAATRVTVNLDDQPIGASTDTDARNRAVLAVSAIAEAADTISRQTPGYATWVREQRGGKREAVVAPIDIAHMLAGQLWNNKLVVATSATMKHGGSLDGYARRVGADAADYVTSDVVSPFDYPKNAILYVARDLPDPRETEFADAAADRTGILIVAAGGRTLSLHTSHKAMRATADRLRGRLEDADIEVLVQGDATRDAIVQALKNHETTGGLAVFATQSFWTGVDVAGGGVSLVIIDKLPFARPTDPLGIARRRHIENRGGNAFAEIDVPRAATLLAQGAGRLIRTTQDKGVVAVMDRRLAIAGYRNQILDTLPPFKRSVSLENVTAFLEQLAKGHAGEAADATD